MMMQNSKDSKMMSAARDRNDDIDGSEENNSKQQHLNRFLSKTYHMVDSEDTSLVCWAPGGDSFFILDADRFAETVLPKYFKHSKFTSFVRQLNFYGFRKIRSSSSNVAASKIQEDESDDEESHSHDYAASKGKKVTVCRFYHEFFQANRPELLARITRATKSAEPPSPGQIEHLRHQVEAMKERVDAMEDVFDRKLQKMKTNIEQDYQRLFAMLDASYKELLTQVLKDRMSIASPATASAGAPSAAALRSAALAMAGSAADNNLFSMGGGMGSLGPSSLMFSGLNRSPPGGLYGNTAEALNNLMRNTNPGNSDMSTFGMLGKFR